MTKKSPTLPLLSSVLIGASLLGTVALPGVATADSHRADRTIVYMTRHAEKQNQLDDNQNSICVDNTDPDTRCAEELSALGELRAQLLAEWFESRGILRKITDVISSDKQRTRQTVEPTAAMLRLNGVALPDTEDMIDDGVRQVPEDKANTAGNELNGNSGSVVPTVDAIQALAPGSVALVAAHSGTIYRIMGGEDTDGNPDTVEKGPTIGLGIDTTVGDNLAEVTLFPKKESDGKVPTFGDIWKIVINNNTGKATVVWRKNLQPQRLTLENRTINRGNKLINSYW